MSLTLDILKAKYPEVHESYQLQEQLPESRYDEKLQFWRENGISCFERWVVPYFLEREKEKKRCCLRLNYPPDGKCEQCTNGKCRYDRVCFMCGKEGHGAFQSYPGGKMKGELKCPTHRNFLAQLAAIRKQYGMEEDDIRALFTPPATKSSAPAPAPAPASAAAAAKGGSKGGESKEAKATAKINGKAEEKAAPPAPVAAGAGASAGAGGEKQTAAAVVRGGRQKTPLPPEKAAADSKANAAGKDKGSPTTVAAAAARASPTPAALLAPAQSNGHRHPPGAADDGDDDDDDEEEEEVPAPAPAPVPAPAPRSRGPPASPQRTGPTAALPVTPKATADAPPPGSPPALFLGETSTGSGSTSSASTTSGRRTEAGLTIDPSLAIPASSAPMASPLGPAHTYELHESNDYGPASILNFGMTRIVKASAGGGSGELNGGMPAYRGQLTNARSTEEVAVTVWVRPPAGSPAQIDALALNRELKTLRMLAAAGAQVARVLHKGVLDIAYPPGPGGTDISAIVSEHSEYGTLDMYLSSYVQVQPEGFSRADLQVAAAHLVETLLRCHNHGVCHRDLRPSNVLVCRGERYHARQITGGFVLKLADFRMAALAGKGHDGEVADCFAAPEVDATTRATGVGYTTAADVWALGVLLYFTATGGRLPFDSHRQAQELALLPAGAGAGAGAEDALKDARLACLRRHGLAEAHPELYDLVERMLRPAPQRIALARARCHPFLWTLHERRTLLIDLANVTSGALGGVPEAAESFSSGLDRFCPSYVFSAPGPGGASVPSWAAQMAPELLAQVQPQSLALEFWWSGKALLQAARNALVYPEPLQRAAAALSPHQPLSPQQAVARYLHQLLEKDFPRLLLLVFELGGLYGSWVWDGDDVAFAWNAQMHAATPPVPPSAHLQPLSHIHHHNHHHLAHRPTQL